MMAATLAFGGKNPVTGKQVMDAPKVPGILAIMATAGLYDDSGKWLYETGLPGEERRGRRHHRRVTWQIRHRGHLAAAGRRRQQHPGAESHRGHLERARRQSVRGQEVAISMRRLALTLVLLTVASSTAYAQKTDVVRLANGDRITGEVTSLSRGQLTFSTDDAGTIYFEWDNVVSLESTRQFDVTTSDGRRFFGSLLAGPPRTLVVSEPAGEVSLQMTDVTVIMPIGSSFWERLDGSLDIGFSYTRSSHVAQPPSTRRPCTASRHSSCGSPDRERPRRTAPTATGTIAPRFRDRTCGIAASICSSGPVRDSRATRASA